MTRFIVHQPQRQLPNVVGANHPPSRLADHLDGRQVTSEFCYGINEL
jgi:hypothetical protein